MYIYVVVSQLRIYRPSLLRSRHLDIKDAQCAENKMTVKISYRVWAFKRGVLDAQKLNFLQK